MKDMNHWFWEAHPTAMALAATFASMYALCILALVVFPQEAMSLFGSWLHGIDIQKIAMTPEVTFRTLYGLVTLAVFTYLGGLLYGYFRKRCVQHCVKHGWI